MADNLCQIELGKSLFPNLGFIHFQNLCGEAHQQTENAGCNDPAPPDAPAGGDVNHHVADEAGNDLEEDAVLDEETDEEE